MYVCSHEYIAAPMERVRVWVKFTRSSLLPGSWSADMANRSQFVYPRLKMIVWPSGDHMGVSSTSLPSVSATTLLSVIRTFAMMDFGFGSSAVLRWNTIHSPSGEKQGEASSLVVVSTGWMPDPSLFIR